MPSYEAVRIHGESNLRALSDGIRVLRTIGIEMRNRNKALPQNSMIDLTEWSLKRPALVPVPNDDLDLLAGAMERSA